MRRVTKQITGTCAALLLGATLATAQTDDSRTTIVTFSAPVALPGVTLPAGSYMFRLADSQTNRNIVQVFDKERSKIFATLVAIPAQRNAAADETVITFKEAPANAAPAVQYWYYPGETRGQEFAYPKKQAMSIANAAHTSVLAVDTDSETFDAMKGGNISRVEPGADTAQTTAASPNSQPADTTAQPSTGSTATTTSAQPSTPPSTEMPSAKPEQPQPAQPQAAPPAAPVTEQPPAPQPTPATEPTPQAAQPRTTETTSVGTTGTRESAAPATGATADAAMPGHSARHESLPNTASTLPLVGFAGLLALFGAAGVRVLRRATARG